MYCIFPVPFSLVSRACRQARFYPHGHTALNVRRWSTRQCSWRLGTWQDLLVKTLYSVELESIRRGFPTFIDQFVLNNVYDPCNAYGSTCTSAEGLRSLALVGNKQTITIPCYHVSFSSHFFESFNSPFLGLQKTWQERLLFATWDEATYEGREAPK